MLRSIFVGSDGLRAGWSSLLFLLLFLGLNAIESAVLSRFLNSQESGQLRPATAFLQESCDLLLVFLVTLFMARVENRKVSSYGFIDERRVPHLVGGVVCGLLALSALVAVLWRAQLLGFEGLSFARYGCVEIWDGMGRGGSHCGFLRRIAPARVSAVHASSWGRLLVGGGDSLNGIRGLAP